MPKTPKLPFSGVNLYHRKNGSFFVQLRRKGRKQVKTITLTARTEALAYAEAVELGRRFEAGLFDPWQERVETITVREGVKRYLASGTRWSDSTRRERRIVLEAFAGTLPSTYEPRDVTARHVQSFALSPALKASTQQGYYSKLRACFGWLRKEGYVRENPCDEVNEPKVSKRTPVYLSRVQAKALIAQAEQDAALERVQPWLPDVIRVALGTGFRQAEICALRWQDVDLIDGRIYARSYAADAYEHRTKSGHDRAVPLLPLAREALRRLAVSEVGDGLVFTGGRSGDKLNPNFVAKQYRETRKRAELPPRYTFHTLRHTFASWLVTSGVPIRHVQEYLGHADIKTTMVYAHLVEDQAHEMAMRAMTLD